MYCQGEALHKRSFAEAGNTIQAKLGSTVAYAAVLAILATVAVIGCGLFICTYVQKVYVESWVAENEELSRNQESRRSRRPNHMESIQEPPLLAQY